jgi:uncharacterized protein (DUF1697 family)
MASVAFIRGVNVGGHNRFQPAALAKALSAYDVVNVGAAGTFVVRGHIRQASLRAALLERLPFDADIMICRARDLVELASDDPFTAQPGGPDIVRFVSVLSHRPRELPALPLRLPAGGAWLLTVTALRGRFVLGVYRRQMKAIGQLGHLERRLGTAMTTRNWNTITAIVKLLNVEDTAHQSRGA